MWLWFSTERMTVGVEVNDDLIIVNSPPIVRGFVGQHAGNLRSWLQRQSGFQENLIS